MVVISNMLFIFSTYQTSDIYIYIYNKSAKKINIKRIIELFDVEQTVPDQNGDILSEKESDFLKKTLLTRNILTTKLMIKDHKKANKFGEYPSILLVWRIPIQTNCSSKKNHRCLSKTRLSRY